MLQGVGSKGVAQIVKPQMLTPRPFQHRGQFFRTAAGSRGESAFFGEGNIQREEQLLR